MRFTRRTVTDLAKLGLTLGFGGITVLTPRAARPALVGALTAVMTRLRPGSIASLAELIGERLPETAPADRYDIATQMQAARVEEILCRGYGVFRADWPAHLEVTGLEHLSAAHDAGRGVVVWMMSFLEATPFNLTARANGFPVTHLSSPTHGISDKGPISRRVVAPVYLRGETRSQGRRVLISREGGLAYLRELKAVLEKEHGTVTIRGDLTKGRQMIQAPHLGALASFPTGAPSLAFRSGAPLLTTATVRLGPFHHRVIIDEPIPASRSDRRDFQFEAVQEFASRLERRVRSHPASRPSMRELPRP